MKATGDRSLEPRAAGFTLLEVMIALAIIGMTVTVILHTVNFHSGIMYENTLSTTIFQAAKEQMAELEMNSTASKGSIDTTGITFENTVSETENPGIIEIRSTVTGHGKMVTLSELIRRKEIR